MKIKRQVLSMLLTLASSIFTVYAQSSHEMDTIQSARIRLKAGIKKDRIHLRWAVDRPAEWQQANSVGFSLKRYTVSRNGSVLDTPELMTIGNFEPAPQERWKSIIETNDQAAIIAQSLYGESFDVELGSTTELGTIAEILNKSQEQEQRFAYALMAADMDFEIAKLAGWGFTDTSVKEGERYLYVVELNQENTPKNIPEVRMGSILADVSMAEVLPQPLDFKGIFQDKTVSLFWEYKQLQDIYTMYYIEKAEDGVHFKPINHLPVMNMTQESNPNNSTMMYIDSLQSNNQQYSYRIRGKNIFDEYGPYSGVIAGSGMGKLEATPRIASYDVLDEQSILLNWEFPTDAEKNILGFELIHSEIDTEKSYRIIRENIPASDRKITTQNITSANYFKIRALGKSGDKTESLAAMVQLNDITPPAIPSGLAGQIDSTGTVQLSWNPNTEIDLEGYHVFRATQEGQEPVRMTPQLISSAFFTDTVPLKSLNSKVYYYVLSADKRKNESELSAMLELEKPDIVPPQPPVFREYAVQDGVLVLKWTKSHSKDVVTHQLYRKALDGSNRSWHIAFQTNEIMSEYQFEDKNLEDDARYSYFLIAIDKAGLRSVASKEITLRNTATKAKVIISGLVGFADKRKKHVELTWRINSPDEVAEIEVYRSEAGKQPSFWKTLPGAQNFVQDTTVEEGNQYTYLLKAMLKSNRPTKVEKITVEY